MTRFLHAALATLIIGVSMAAATTASAQSGADGPFCGPTGVYVFLYPGQNCQHGVYHGNTRYIENKSSPYSGSPGVFLSNSAGTRITEFAACYQLGCTVSRNFGGGGAAGFATSRNAGNFQSNFQGYLSYG